MGLLSKLSATDLYADKLSDNSGLLYKAENLSKSGVSFFSFLKQFKIDIIFELKFYSYYYFCSKSFGLDAQSILQTNSSKAFWDGIITREKKIFNFSTTDNSIAPFLQFFSFDLKDSIESLSIYKYSEDSILILANSKLTNEIIDSYPTVKADKTQNLGELQAHSDSKAIFSLFSIDFSDCVESISQEKLKKNENLKLEYKNVLYNELFTRLQFFFATPSSLAKTSKSAANIVFVSKTNIEQELILSQLIKLYSKVIGASSELISFNFLGERHSVTEIKEFLKVI